MKKVKVIKSIILIAAIMLGTLSVGDVNSVNAETASPTDASPTNAKWLSNEVESDDDYEWLSHDFDAVSFEKGMTVREDHKNLFDNKEYQSKLSARKMLEIAQEEFQEGYKEVWVQ